jgi:cadmium resistance protein CadD (predicted permease)
MAYTLSVLIRETEDLDKKEIKGTMIGLLPIMLVMRQEARENQENEERKGEILNNIKTKMLWQSKKAS